MVRPIHESFNYWLRPLIRKIGNTMINARIPSFEEKELYKLLVPDTGIRDILLTAAYYLPSRNNNLYSLDIPTSFPDGVMMPIRYDVTFFTIGRNNYYNHLLFPGVMHTIEFDSYLGQYIVPAAIVAREWSTLHTVVTKLTEMNIDQRALGNLFPWVRALIIDSDWTKNRDSFYRIRNISTKADKALCDATFEAAMGQPYNVPILTPLIIDAAHSGNKLFGQSRLLISSSSYKNQKENVQSTIIPLISETNVIRAIHEDLKSIEEFSKKGWMDEMRIRNQAKEGY